LLARIVLQIIWPIARHSDVPLKRARLIYAIIKQVLFSMCKPIILTMFELQQDS